MKQKMAAESVSEWGSGGKGTFSRIRVGVRRGQTSMAHVGMSSIHNWVYCNSTAAPERKKAKRRKAEGKRNYGVLTS